MIYHSNNRNQLKAQSSNSLIEYKQTEQQNYFHGFNMPSILLKRFMIFNLNDGHNESQEGDKLIYHWTKEEPNSRVSLAEQIDDVCLCDASVTFSQRMTVDAAILSIDEGKQRTGDDSSPEKRSGSALNQFSSLSLSFESTLVHILAIEPELSIWMAVHIGPQKKEPTSAPTTSAVQTSNPFNPSSVSSDLLERMMINIYNRFCLLNGSFVMIADRLIGHHNPLNTSDKSTLRTGLRSICSTYFDLMLPSIHFSSVLSNTASLYNYISYLDLDPLTLMKVISFINHLTSINLMQLRHTIVIFNNQLLWSSLKLIDTRLLYNYLVSVVIKDALQEELSKEVDKVRRIAENKPIYLTDEKQLNGLGDDTYKQMESHDPIHSGRLKLARFFLTVFRSSNDMTLALVLADPDLEDLLLECERILTSDNRLGVIPLVNLAQTVGQNFLRDQSNRLSKRSGKTKVTNNNGKPSR